MKESVQYLIIGGGINGVVTAYHLAEAGSEVLLIERKRIAHEGSSANAGTLSVQNKPVKMTASSIEAVKGWLELDAALGGKLNYHRTGGYRVAQSEQQLAKIQTIAAQQREKGLEVIPCSAEEILKAEPNITPTIVGGNYCALDGYGDSKNAVRFIAEAAREKGAEIMEFCPAQHISYDGKRYIVETGQGRIEAQKVLFAAGMWSKELVAELGFEVPIDQRLFQMQVTEPAPPLINHVITHANGNLTIKQSSENGSLLIGGGWRGIGDYTKFQKDVNLDNMVGNAKIAIECFPRLAQLNILRSWAGFDARTRDESPLFGEIPGCPNAYIVGAGQGGFTTGPAYGKFMAELLMTGRTHPIMEEFSVRRFI
ncbi:MAG: FAD-binding oxidoreductase [Clostridia bacterium]|nr:FAD-binding oxidoreductase [Clostridia bacterium]